MNEKDRRRDSTDDGELSEGSGHSPSPRRKNDSKKPAHKRITFNTASDDELFTIQPKDSNYDRREKESKSHKHERRDEHHRDKKEKHEEKHKRRHEKEERKRDRSRERRDHRDKKEGRKHKRSTSPEGEVPKKREKKVSETKDERRKYEIPLFARTREKFSAKRIEVQEIEHSPPPEDIAQDEVVVVTRAGGVTSFTTRSDAKKYSKFDSSPEHELEDEDEHDKTPEQSDVELIESEPEEESLIEASFDVENAIWEDLSDEQKASLTPDTKKRLEDDWQKRLIAELPVYYPGIQGCRNVEEFKCENRIEEGTYGVVFRARDKRTEEVVALKRLKMEKEREGFPITSLREINMLLKCGLHPNIVNVREVVIGSTLDKIYLVMEFVEHDMKALMETMRQKNKTFSVGVQKSLMRQLLSGMKHMHDLWILHRDLKTSNLLLSHKGILKIADFGLAREFGEPLKPYTSVVVTLWYRAPELLLGQKLYSTPIDMWSVGCIMAEFILQKPLFPGQNEQSQIEKIFLELGTPSERVWPGYDSLPHVKSVQLPQYTHNQLRKKFPAKLIASEHGFQLLNGFLRYDPERRLTAEEALAHEWFKEAPLPTPPEEFPTFPAKSEHHKPPPPSHHQKKKEAAPLIVNATTAKLMAELNVNPEKMRNSGFSLKF